MSTARKQNKLMQFTALIAREGNAFVATCPELEVVSEGDTIEEARKNLAEAVSIVLEEASPQELKRRTKSEFYIARFEVAVG